MATAAGMKVTERIMAPNRASITVYAMGWNILPSTPVKVRMGRYTAMMMKTPKMLGRATSLVAEITMANRSSRSSTRPRRCCPSARRRMQFSTMMTAPSTINPKSSAPRLIRLPLMRPWTIPVMVNSMEKGMTHAVISAARMFPSRRKRTTITSTAPSSRFFLTVSMVRSTRVVRSYTVLAIESLGQAAVDFVHLQGHAARNVPAVLSHQHEDRPQHRLLAVHGGGPGAQFLADGHFGHAIQVDGNAFMMADDHAPDVVQAGDLAGHADQLLFPVVLDIARADIGVVAGQGVHDVLEREPIGHQLVRIGRDLVLPFVSADGVDFHHAGQVAQLGLDDPILHRAEIGGRERICRPRCAAPVRASTVYM